MDLEKDIIERRGNNKTKEIMFPDGVIIDGVQLLSFYTWRGSVCIIDALGMDVEFDVYSPEDQQLIYDEIMKLLVINTL